MYRAFVKSSVARKTRPPKEQGRLIFLLLQVLGAMPLTRGKNGGLEFHLLSLVSVYSAVVLTLLGAVGLFVAVRHVELLLAVQLSYDTLIAHITAFFFMGFQLVPFLSCLEAKRTVALHRSWRKIEAHYSRLRGRGLPLQCSRPQWLAVGTLAAITVYSVYGFRTFLFTLFEHFPGTSGPEFLWPASLLTLYYAWVIVAFQFKWYLVMAAARQAATALLALVQGASLQPGAVQEWHSLWVELKYLVEGAGSTFSLSYSYYLMYNFLLTTGTAYGFIEAKVTGRQGGWLFGVVPLLGLSQVLLIADSAHRTTSAIGDQFCEVLTRQVWQERQGGVGREALRGFLQTVASSPPSISLAGFVVLNRRFTLSVVGTLVTYIIIVLQMKGSSGLPEEPSASTQPPSHLAT